VLQTLFHVPNQVAGIPVFGIGLLLALWGLFSLGLLAWLGRRQGFNGETWSYVPVLALVAAVIAWLLPAVCDEQGLPVRGYGALLLAAVTSGTGLAVWRARRLGLQADLVFSVAFWMFVPGIIGARAFYVIEYWHDQYLPIYQQDGLRAMLGAVVNATQGGLVVYGSLIGAAIGLLAFVRTYRLPLLAVCDLIAPAMMLGLSLGRLGCLMNGCCFGGVCDHAWAVTFPPGSPPYYAQVVRGQIDGILLALDREGKPVIHRIDPDSPAGRAGLRKNDRIEKIDGRAIRSVDEAYRGLSGQYSDSKPMVIEVGGRPAVTLPAAPNVARSLPVHPTQIYSSINALLLCLLLLAYDPFSRRDGELFALMITVYPITRFLLEIIRTDESAIFGTGLSISQNVSLTLLLAAACLWFYILRRPAGKAFETAGEAG